MSEREKYANGGLIKGGGGMVRIERLGVGPDGRCLYSINGGRPVRIYTADEVRTMGRIHGLSPMPADPRVLDALDGRESREPGT